MYDRFVTDEASILRRISDPLGRLCYKLGIQLRDDYAELVRTGWIDEHGKLRRDRQRPGQRGPFGELNPDWDALEYETSDAGMQRILDAYLLKGTAKQLKRKARELVHHPDQPELPE